MEFRYCSFECEIPQLLYADRVLLRLALNRIPIFNAAAAVLSSRLDKASARLTQAEVRSGASHSTTARIRIAGSNRLAKIRAYARLFLTSTTFYGGATYQFRSALLSNILPDSHNHMMIIQSNYDFSQIAVAIWRDGWSQAIWFNNGTINDEMIGLIVQNDSGVWGPIPQ